LSTSLDALFLDLLEWIGPEPKPYEEVMDAWRTSCPRLTVWEGANDRGLVERRYADGHGAYVCLRPSVATSWSRDALKVLFRL
jgi:hypothetical protein